MTTLTHLYFHGEHYDLRTGEEDQPDLDFWREEARETEGPILVLGCGTGRIAIPMAREGKEVWGVDWSESMLEEARKKSKGEDLDLHWEIADFRNCDLNQNFDLILIPINTFCHLYSREDLERFLATVAQHLNEEGQLAIDIFNPSLEVLTRDPETRYAHSKYPHPRGGVVRVEETISYNRATQLNTITLYYQMPEKKEEVKDTILMRIYFPRELEIILHYNKWEISEKYGDYDRSPFTSQSKRQILFTRPRFKS